MRPSHTFRVIPSLPEKLEKLRVLAHNLWWCWNHEAIELFRRLDRDGWESSGHNPVLMLGTVRQERLEQVAEDDGFMAHCDRVYREFDRYLKSKSTWYRKTYANDTSSARNSDLRIAYFSAEFGLTESLGIYAGGLGILAGDHLKSASDLGLPFLAVGLLYQQGYFRQYLNPDGWQQELYPENDFYNLPLTLERQVSGAPLLIEVELSWPCSKGSGMAGSGGPGSPLSAWIPISTKTGPSTGTSPTNCMAGTTTCASVKRSCWASAAFAP